MIYSNALKETVQSYLDKESFPYTFHEEKGFFLTGVKIKNKLKRCEIIIAIREENYTVYALIAVSAEPSNAPAVSEYLHRANYGLNYGSFEFDPTDGEIRYKFFVDCGTNCDCIPTQSVIRHSIELPALMFEKYGDGLLGVLFGLLSPTEAIALADS